MNLFYQVKYCFYILHTTQYPFYFIFFSTYITDTRNKYPNMSINYLMCRQRSLEVAQKNLVEDMPVHVQILSQNPIL